MQNAQSTSSAVTLTRPLSPSSAKKKAEPRAIRYLSAIRSVLELKAAPWLIAFTGMALGAVSLWGGLSADDHFLRMVIQDYPGMEELETGRIMDTFVFAEGSLERNEAFMNRGMLPWWSTPEARLAFWRPLASLTHYLDFAFWGDNAFVMHLQNLVWYGLLAFIMAWLYSRMLSTRWIALLATLLYVWDDAHGMPVGWIANRNALMAMCFGVLTLIMHDKWRRDGQWWAMPVGLFLFLLGLLCGEATLAICGYLFAHALFLDRSGWRLGILSLIPYGLIIIPWRIVYQFLGYGATGSGMYLDPVREPFLFLGGLVQRLPLLLNAQLAYPPAALTVWAPTFARIIHILFALAVLGVLIWVMAPTLKRSNMARFWLVGMIVAALPVCATFPMDRLLFFAGIGGMGLVAQFLGQYMKRHAGETPDDDGVWDHGPRWQKAATAVAIMFVVIHLVISPLSFPVRSLTMWFTGNSLERAVNSLPSDPSVTDRALVLVCAPSDFDSWHVPIMRSSMAEPVPRHTWALTVGPYASTCTRIDDRTLRIRQHEGFIPYPEGRMFRGFASHFKEGDVVELDGMTATIMEVNETGHRPHVVEFAFDAPLESDSLEWVYYDEGVYRPWELPEINETVRIPKAHMFGFGVRARSEPVEGAPEDDGPFGTARAR